jgi:hypothetical protein
VRGGATLNIRTHFISNRLSSRYGAALNRFVAGDQAPKSGHFYHDVAFVVEMHPRKASPKPTPQ